MYLINGWDERFENERSRTREHCSWCPIPNKQDGLGYGLILLEPDGPSIYGAFVAVVLVCSKHSKPRFGLLSHCGTHDSQPFSVAELAVKTKFPIAVLTRMLEVCSRPDVGWISLVDDLHPVCTPPAPRLHPPNPPRREEHRSEKNGSEPCMVDSNLHAILHRPENAALVKLKSKDDFGKYDVTTLFCSMIGENTGPGVGWMSKQLKTLATKKGDAAASTIFREELLRMWSELQQGEQVRSVGAAMTERFKTLMQKYV